jgi:two-component system chemotaxis response regulator CheB
MTELRHDDGVFEYRCLVGHRYSPRTLLAAHSEAQEKALWAAVVALEEAANLAREVSPRFNEEVAGRLRAQGDKRLKQAAEIRGVLQDLEPFQTE